MAASSESCAAALFVEPDRTTFVEIALEGFRAGFRYDHPVYTCVGCFLDGGFACPSPLPTLEFDLQEKCYRMKHEDATHIIPGGTKVTLKEVQKYDIRKWIVEGGPGTYPSSSPPSEAAPIEEQASAFGQLSSLSSAEKFAALHASYMAVHRAFRTLLEQSPSVQVLMSTCIPSEGRSAKVPVAHLAQVAAAISDLGMSFQSIGVGPQATLEEILASIL